ncbi:metallophosphoesterase [Myxococcota bacterium]|nr:metallophosphoesterase [Myxococcota bacterium]
MRLPFFALLLIPFTLFACEPATLSSMEPLRQGTGFDLGPWVTLVSADPFRICISWLSANREAAALVFSIDSTNLSRSTDADDDGTLHSVCLALTPGSTLFYRPESTRHPYAEDLFSVHAPEPAWPLNIVVLGDIQPVDGSTMASAALMLERVHEENPDWVIHCGDSLQNGSELASWERLLTVLPRLAAGTPLALVPGNHDVRYDDGASWAAGFPQEFEPGLDRRHRVLRAMDARLFLIDAFYGPMSERDFAWLEKELADAQKAGLWRFVFFHGSILSSGMENTDTELQRQLIPLFDRTRVHAVFYGHDHMFEHYEVAYGPWVFDADHEPSGRPIHYFLTGGGGARLEHEYGLLERPTAYSEQNLHNVDTGEDRVFTFERRPWDGARINELADPAWSRDGGAYYHDCTQACYQDDAAFWGHRYGENVLHYLTLEIGQSEAVITARYPDGSVMAGPDGMNPQTWRIFR